MQNCLIGGWCVMLSTVIGIYAMEDTAHDGNTIIIKPLTSEQQQKQKKPAYLEKVSSEVDLGLLVERGECRIIESNDEKESKSKPQGLGKAFEILRKKRQKGCYCTMHHPHQPQQKDQRTQLQKEYERFYSAPCLKYHVEPKSSPQPQKLSKERTEFQLSRGSKELLSFDKEAAEQMIADLTQQRDELAKLVGDNALIEFEWLQYEKRKVEEQLAQERAEHHEVNARLCSCIERLERQLKHERQSKHTKRKKKVSIE